VHQNNLRAGTHCHTWPRIDFESWVLWLLMWCCGYWQVTHRVQVIIQIIIHVINQIIV
jgi:hypothetical protein